MNRIYEKSKQELRDMTSITRNNVEHSTYFSAMEKIEMLHILQQVDECRHIHNRPLQKQVYHLNGIFDDDITVEGVYDIKSTFYGIQSYIRHHEVVRIARINIVYMVAAMLIGVVITLIAILL